MPRVFQPQTTTPRRGSKLASNYFPWLPFAPLLAITALVSSSGLFARADEAAPAATFAPEQVEFFENSIRPLLASACIDCHGPRKQEAGLRLDSREALITGGESGPAAVPGEPAQSLLISALHYKDDSPQMPPKGKLDAEKIESLTKWVSLGLPWTETKVAPRPMAAAEDTWQLKPEDREFWAYQPVVQPALPAVSDTAWPANAIDAFILARLEQERLRPAAAADRRTLLRRLTFDLTGMPPTPEEVAEFLADESPLAYEQVVERLLASPQYGERMARLWLDVARYGEDQAHTFEARQYPQGFRYRDWVTAAFNGDLPYDEFVTAQIAADQLRGAESADPADLAALGYFACGPVYYGDKNQLDQYADRIDTLTRGFLGLTVACARCHDHKFDPIPTSDYYALAGVFASTEYVEIPLVSQAEIDELEKDLKENEKKKKNRAKKYPHIHALKDAEEPRNLAVHIRGNPETLGAEAPRRFLQVLATDSAAPFTVGSGRRELAAAIASPDNPLTARVLVNRLWQQHFGRGIVGTASNFGILGERPTHPELLDYLAARFVASGWSIKAIHREIVLSATYRQSTAAAAQTLAADPENRLLGRASRRRLEVEAWRDAMLAASGELDTALGGPPQELAETNNRRRTLYGEISRHELNHLLRLFDFPDPNITSDQRTQTTVPLQQLFVLNSEFMVANARALAERVSAASADDEHRVRLAYELVYSRPPTDAELDVARNYLLAEEDADEDQAGAAPAAQLSRWERYAQALLASNEFLYVD
ncbi:MAG: PSD1 and planctomycete cytochrome C domain-containing protein [Pirellulaceae bacterium]|nr:PSD1 and planctomycete cytochrome C domain-containing protein [Pirellulaceae bacterium]